MVAPRGVVTRSISLSGCLPLASNNEAAPKAVCAAMDSDEEREFWDTHDAFEVLGEEGWTVGKPGEIRVTSLHVSRVGNRGATVRVPKHWLDRIGADKHVRARVDGSRLIIEAA